METAHHGCSPLREILMVPNDVTDAPGSKAGNKFDGDSTRHIVSGLIRKSVGALETGCKNVACGV
jgi:hypothetical protein